MKTEQTLRLDGANWQIARDPDNGCLAVVVLNASEDAVEDAELVLRTGATAGIFTDMRCQDTRLAAAGQDGPYTRFNLPRMAAWDFALMNIGRQA